VEKYRANLEKLRQMEPREIINDISAHVTKIYGREDHHLGNMMALASPEEIDFPEEGRIRGRVSGINAGDTGTGKTTIIQSLCETARVGLQVSGMTASRTGITYGCEHDERRGWRIKAGAFLKMNRQILIVDEAQDLAMQELKTMAEGMDTGFTRIDRIQNKVFESKTRVIFNCNPKHPRNPGEQRTMDSYQFGCEAIKGIFPQMMIRRIDIVMFSASWDIENKDVIYYPEKPDCAQQVSAEDLRALIFYAWNLKPEQVIIDDNTAHYIRQVAKYLSEKFGGADDLPIVYAEDFRKTMARLSVAYAILDLATNDDFSQVIVNPGHVAEVCEFLERIYEAENARLDAYAEEYRRIHGLADHKKIEAGLIKVMQEGQDRRYRVLFILRELLKNEAVKQKDLFDALGVSRQTVHRDMAFFTSFNLATSSTRHGYQRTPKLIRLVRRIEKESPELLPWHLLDEERDL
jgi:hypothetical protein